MANRKIVRAGLRGKLLTTAALAGVGIASLYGRRAYAQIVCTPGGGVYSCAGSSADGQAIAADNAEVEIGALDINTGDPFGLSVRGYGALSVTDTGPGPRSIISSNMSLEVMSRGDDGATPGSIIVNTDADITGGNAVMITNYGAGATDITLTGDINASLTAISLNAYGAGDVSLTTGGVVSSAVGAGVSVRNQGTGDTRITIAATAEHRTSDGYSLFQLYQEGPGDLIVVNDGNLYGYAFASAIYASVTGGGAFDITNNDYIRVGAFGAGIQVGDSSGGSIVNSGEIYGSGQYGRGISARAGTGVLTITNDASGEIDFGGAYAAVGIRAASTAGAVINNAGDIIAEGGNSTGISATLFGAGGVTITNSGLIDTYDNYDGGVGIFADTGSGGAGNISIVNAAGGEIEAYRDAIRVVPGYDSFVGNLSVTNSGELYSYGGAAIHIEHDGQGAIGVSNTATGEARGRIIAQHTGTGAVTFTNDGDAFRGARLVHEGSGAIALTNSGLIQRGTQATHEGTGSIAITNSGNLRGDVDVVHSGTGDILIDNAGGISGMIDAYHEGVGDIVIVNGAAGDIYAYDYGVYVEHAGAGAIRLTNLGEIGSYYRRGVYLKHEGSGDIAVNNQGQVYGDTVVQLTGNGGVAFSNAGLFDGDVEIGRAGAGAVVLTNGPGGFIDGAAEVLHAGDGDVTVTNAGSVEDRLEAYLGGAGNIVLTNSGDVGQFMLAQHYGDGDVSVTNAAGASAGGAGGVLHGNGDVTVLNDGDIGDFGLVGAHYGAGALTVTNNGTVNGVFGIAALTSMTGKYSGSCGCLDPEDATAITQVRNTGNVYGAYAGAMLANGKYAGEMNFESTAGSKITGEFIGMIAVGGGAADLNITVDGDLHGELGSGMMLQRVGEGATNAEIGGGVSSTDKYGIVAASAGGPVNLTVKSGASVSTTGDSSTKYGVGGYGATAILATSAGSGPYADGPVNITIAGAVDSGPNSTQAIIMAGEANDRLDLHNTFQITGTVDAMTDPAAGADTLAFGGAGDGTFDVSRIGDAAQFRGFEAFEKNDASKWVLTGANTGISQFAVNAGDLRVNGNMSGATFTVASGSTLGGSGLLGTLTVNGLVAPGNSIGTLNVVNITLNPSAVYEVEIDSSGASDRIAATGTATINGATVNVVTLNPDLSYTDGQAFTILTAGGGVSGAFGGIVENSLFLDFRLTYAANSVSLIADVVRIPVEFATTVNQTNAALELSAFPRTGDSGAVYTSVLRLRTEDEVRAAFDAMSGEAHASNMLAAMQSADLFQSALARRSGSLSGNVAGMNERFVDGASIWGAVLGQGGEFHADGNAAELEHNATGLAFGAEGGMSRFGGAMTAGVGFGYDNGRGSVDGRASAADIETWHAGAYTAWDNETVRVSAAASYGKTQIASVRSIGWAGLNRTATAEREGDIFGATLETAVRLPSGPMGFSLAPVVLVDYLTGTFETAQETGAGALNALVHEKDFTRLEAGFGLEAAYDVDLGGRAFAVEGRAVYRSLLSGRSPVQPISLEGAPGGVFGVYGPQQGDRLTLGLGVSSDVTEALSLNARIDASVSDNGDTTRATIGGAWKF